MIIIYNPRLKPNKRTNRTDEDIFRGRWLGSEVVLIINKMRMKMRM